MLCPYLLISINELLISIISFIDINKYGLNVKTAAHTSAKRGVCIDTHVSLNATEHRDMTKVDE